MRAGGACGGFEKARPAPDHASLVLPVIAVVLLACGDETEPGAAIAPEPCRAQGVYEQATVSQSTEQDVRVALLDAAERLAPGLGAGERTAELTAALRSAQASGAPDAACRAIRMARAALGALPDAAESLPDRAAIQHVLDVAETYYARAR